MKISIRIQSRARGIALVIVMIVILVLGILAGGLAYSMKVETKLARNTSFEGDLEWLGRSGVEFARYILVQQLTLANEPWDSLNQKWAGGPAGTNEILAAISLKDNRLGQGTFSISMVDLERKLNINLVNDQMLQQALSMAGADPVNLSLITDSFKDWRDLDDDTHLSGTESEDYLQNPNPGFSPYLAKNGPIDDISEILLIRGITPEMYWGPGGSRRLGDYAAAAEGAGGSESSSGAGLVDLFTTLSSGMLNLNTASVAALQLLPGIDPPMAQAIIAARAGWDGADGTEDDVPFRTVGELINVPGMIPQVIPQLQAFCSTRSTLFEVKVEAEINRYKRYFTAVIRRNPSNPRDVQILQFHWK